jgi:hypothetical protein
MPICPRGQNSPRTTRPGPAVLPIAAPRAVGPLPSPAALGGGDVPAGPNAPRRVAPTPEPIPRSRQSSDRRPGVTVIYAANPARFRAWQRGVTIRPWRIVQARLSRPQRARLEDRARLLEIRPSHGRAPGVERGRRGLVGPALGAHVPEPLGLGEPPPRVALRTRGEEREAGRADQRGRISLADPLERMW